MERFLLEIIIMLGIGGKLHLTVVEIYFYFDGSNDYIKIQIKQLASLGFIIQIIFNGSRYLECQIQAGEITWLLEQIKTAHRGGPA